MTKRVFLSVNLALLALMLAVTAFVWQRLGAMPQALLTLMVAVAVFNLPVGLLPYFKFRRFTLEGSERGHFLIWTGLTAIVALIHAGTALKVLGLPVDVVGGSGVLMGLFLAFMGNFATKLREGYAYGILTPWTLASDRAWKRAHRLFGWLLVVMGLGVSLASLVYRGPLFAPVFFGGILAVCLIPSIASYFYWKQDPDRRPPGGAGASADA